MARAKSEDGSEPKLQFDVPLPLDDKGLRVRVARMELDRLIKGRLELLAGQNTEHGQALVALTIHDAELEFFPDFVRVRLSIPVSKQPSLFGSRKRRKSLSQDLFDARNDEQAQAAAEACLDIVQVAAEDVRQLSALIQDEALDSPALIAQASLQPNKALRDFVVRGGVAEVDVDGHPVSIQAQPGPRAIEASQPVTISIMLDVPSGSSAPMAGTVTSAGVGAGSMVGPGKRLRLGFMKSRPLQKGLLLIASELQVEVQIEVMLAVSTIRLTTLTAEVLKVLNPEDISARLTGRLAHDASVAKGANLQV
jgi:hypothetical protein